MPEQPKLTVEWVRAESLHADPANVRRHPERNLDAIKASLARFGQQKPIVVDADGIVRAGNGTLEAARALGWANVAVVRTPLRGSEATAYAIADNRTAELAEWDGAGLAEQLRALQSEDFDLAAVGYTGDEVDALIDQLAGELAGAAGGTEDEPPPVDKAEELLAKWRVEPGQLWQIGRHRLLCGDSTKREDVERLMGGEMADTLVSDPPYGVGYEYATHDDSDNATNLDLVRSAWLHAPAVKIWTCGLMNLARDLAWNPKARVLCWHKGFAAAGNGLGGASTWEPVLAVGVKGGSLPNDYLSFATDRIPGLRELHTCPKPVALYEHLIKHMAGHRVYEPFCGSGTTIVAAEQTGRTCYGIEIAPKYCAVILERLERLGLSPSLQAGGRAG